MSDSQGAWLETTTGKHLPIHGNLSIGRSPKTSLTLDSPKVSRRHAIINVQNVGEFWLIDLGSSNGTFVNKRRLHQPMRLCNQDQIVIGDAVFTFRQPDEITDAYRTTQIERTIREIQNVPCWLLVADIENFTPLSRTLTSDRLAVVIGTWVAKCKEIVESHQGMIDKYLGDGFLAYWRTSDNTSEDLVASLSELKEIQSHNAPPFRLALHFGSVAIGGMPSMGEESLMGKDVNFVFRMEKLAGSLGISILISGPARSKLSSLAKTESAGSHELKGFEGKHEFFAC